MIPAFGELGERLRRSTIQVSAGAQGSGSGVIWDATGLAITNAHVARQAVVGVTLWDGRRYPAKVTLRDDAVDLAALRFQAPDLHPATIGDSSKLAAGELVVAVGNPLGFTGALTTGVVQSIGPVPGLTGREYVQADVRLAPGNSGGPLSDALGRVVGINTMVIGTGPAVAFQGGLGLAIPSNRVRRFLAQGANRRMLGVAIRPVRVRFRSREALGLLVVDVVKGGAAQMASLQVGDILVSAAGRMFETVDDLALAVEAAPPSLPVQFLRGDRTRLRETHVAFREEAVAA